MPVRRSALIALIALVTVLSAVLGVQSSGATFTGVSTQTVQATSAKDWVPPAVSVDTPAAALAGTASVSATASDVGGTGVANVQIQYSPADQNTWTTLCTDTSAPYSCTWATPQVPDGRYDLRAIATDNAAFTSTSAIVPARVANNFGVVLADIPQVVKGSVALSATLANPGSSTASYLWFEYAVSGATNWSAVPGCGKQAAAGSLTSRTCTWNTTGNLTYDVRAIAIVGASTVSDVQSGVLVDNVAPTGTVSVPNSPLRGLITVASGDAADGDEGSGVASVELQIRRSGQTTWNSCGVATEDPFGCDFDTASVADGAYEFRALITDAAGNSYATTITSRTIDNSVSTVSVSAPTNGATVSGTVAVNAVANSTRGVTSVRLDVSSDTGATWLPICTDTTAPWTCSWDTSAVIVRKSFLIRAVMLENDGTVTTSASVTVTVDNSPLRGVDVQAQNVGTLGMLNQGDKLILTFSGIVDPATIRPGWNGATTAISLVARDKGVAGSQIGNFDRIDFPDANLGQVGLAQDLVKGGRSVTFNGSTMVASTTTVAGVPATVVTVTLGTTSNSGWLRSSNTAGALRWLPSALVAAPTLVLETGASDRDL